jgi:tellurite resistance protein
MADPLDPSGRALERAFYPKAASDYREQLRLRALEQAAVPALREASGLADEALLRRLAGLGIRAETLAALTMIPIVEVAWADGHMDARERNAIMTGAESAGIEPGTASHGLLRLWTADAPAPALLSAWRDYIAALGGELDVSERARLAEKIVGRARAVAEAAGGARGRSAVSPEEERVLQGLARAFDGAGDGAAPSGARKRR